MCPDFLDLSITDYKTKSANAWKGGLLSAVAPAVGVSRENWAAAWLKVRAELGASLERSLDGSDCCYSAAIQWQLTDECGKVTMLSYGQVWCTVREPWSLCIACRVCHQVLS